MKRTEHPPREPVLPHHERDRATDPAHEAGRDEHEGLREQNDGERPRDEEDAQGQGRHGYL